MKYVAIPSVLVAMVLALGACAAPQKAVEKKVAYAFWPPSPDEPRIQFMLSLNSSDDLQSAPSDFETMVLGRETRNVLAVSKPYGVAAWNGRIYVCDVRGTGGIIVLDLKQKQTRLMGSRGVEALKRAVDLCVAPDGTKYVADMGRSAIAVFSPEERSSGLFVLKDSAPVSVAVAGDRLYVVDMQNQHVKVLDRASGQVLSVIGGPGGKDGQFIRPLKVTTDTAGNILVTDVIKCRVQKFAPDGTLLLAFGQPGDRPGMFVRPKHMAMGADGILYVVDAAFNNVQLFDEHGKVMMFFGSAGPHPGAMDLPAGIAILEDGLELFADYIHPAFEAQRVIVVTNQFGPYKVALYAMGQLKPGRTLADLATSRVETATGVAPATQPVVPATQPARP